MDHGVALAVQHAKHVIHRGHVAVELVAQRVGTGTAGQRRARVWAVTGACICQLFTLWNTTAGIL